MGFHAGANYCALPVSDKTWIVQNVLPVGGLVNIYGKPKTGKSMIGLQLASAISSGKLEWLSFGIATHGRVAYFQVDTPRSLWLERVKHFRDHGLDISGIYFADREDEDCPYPFDILGEGYHWLKKQIELMEEKPIVLVIDTTREIHSGSEDESAQMKNVIAHVQTAAPGMAVIFISHARKGNPQNFGMQPDMMDENRGSGYVAGRMDCVVWLREKALSAKGRALAETEIAVEMDPNSYLINVSDLFVKDAIQLTRDGMAAGAPPAEIIKALHDRWPKKSFDQCRGIIRRICPATV